MATLTLKRSLEFDPLHSRIAKRQRCMPTSAASQMSPVRQNTPNASPFAEVVPKLSNDQIAVRIGYEIKRLQHRRRAMPSYGSMSPPSTSGCYSPPLSTTDASVAARALRLAVANTPSTVTHETPLLTLRQVGLVCERLLKEREDQLLEEYDKVLNDKLTEQYEAFLRFNHDQLNRRFGETAASYVS